MLVEEIKELPPEYSVGIKAIDKQHAQIIHFLSKIVTYKKSSSVKEKTNSNMIDVILLDLKGYAKNHFEYEAKLMDQAKYPKLKEHLAMHDIFIKKIKEAQRFKDNEKTLQELAQFLKDWFLNHINKVDKDAVKIMKEIAKNDDEVFEPNKIVIKSKLE